MPLSVMYPCTRFRSGTFTAGSWRKYTFSPSHSSMSTGTSSAREAFSLSIAMHFSAARMIARPPCTVNIDPIVCHSHGQYCVSICGYGRIFSGGIFSASPATCCTTMRSPCPTSAPPMLTVALPSGLSLM